MHKTNTKVKKIIKRIEQLYLLKHISYRSTPIFLTTTSRSNGIALVFIFKELG